jgi:hypothetical protein
LPGMQAAAQTFLKSRFPSDEADWRKPMTLDDKKLAEQTYKKLASALQEVK